MPSVNGSYWFLTALAAQLYMIMYLVMFLAAFKLRKLHPNHRGPFRIPGGWFGMSLVGGMGIIGVVVTLIVSFIPPDNINVGSSFIYEISLILGLIVMCLPPFINLWWVAKSEQ